jgi:hypothetical protein
MKFLEDWISTQLEQKSAEIGSIMPMGWVARNRGMLTLASNGDEHYPERTQWQRLNSWVGKDSS